MFSPVLAGCLAFALPADYYVVSASHVAAAAEKAEVRRAEAKQSEWLLEEVSLKNIRG